MPELEYTITAGSLPLEELLAAGTDQARISALVFDGHRQQLPEPKGAWQITSQHVVQSLGQDSPTLFLIWRRVG